MVWFKLGKTILNLQSYGLMKQATETYRCQKGQLNFKGISFYCYIQIKAKNLYKNVYCRKECDHNRWCSLAYVLHSTFQFNLMYVTGPFQINVKNHLQFKILFIWSVYLMALFIFTLFYYPYHNSEYVSL